MPASDWGIATVAPSAPSVREARDVLGERMMAGLFDLVLLGALYFGYAALLGGIHKKVVLPPSGGEVHSTWVVSVTGYHLVLYLAACLVYYFALEALYGRTVGKRIVGLRVVAGDGTPASTRAILIRTVARIVDALPILYIVGLISMLCGRPRRRLGDRLAGTIVIHG